MKHSQDKGKDLHQTMVKIQKSHEEHVETLAAELSCEKWRVKVAEEMFRIITGGDPEMDKIVRRQAVENIGPDGEGGGWPDA